jgi:hypothetical protein
MKVRAVWGFIAVWIGVPIAAMLAVYAWSRAATKTPSSTEQSIREGDVLVASGGIRVNERLANISRDGHAVPEDQRLGPWACYPTLGDSLWVRTILPEGVYRIAVMSGSERGCEGWVLRSAFATASELRGPVIDSSAAERAGRIAYEAWIGSCLSQRPGWTRATCEARYRRSRDSINTASTSSAAFAPPSNSKADVKKQLELELTWGRGGFDNVMIATFTIGNKSDRPVKDFVMTCVHFAPSGTELGSNTETIYELVPAHGKKWIPDFNMGFISSQTEKARCTILDFELAE